MPFAVFADGSANVQLAVGFERKISLRVAYVSADVPLPVG